MARSQSEFLQWLSVTLSWSEGWQPVSTRAGGWWRGATQHCSGQLQTTMELWSCEDKTSHRTLHITSHHIIAPLHHHTSLTSFQNADYVKVMLIRTMKVSQRINTGGLTSLCCWHSVRTGLPSLPGSTRHPTGVVFLLLGTADWTVSDGINTHFYTSTACRRQQSHVWAKWLHITTHHNTSQHIIKCPSHRKLYLMMQALPGWGLSYHLPARYRVTPDYLSLVKQNNIPSLFAVLYCRVSRRYKCCSFNCRVFTCYRMCCSVTVFVAMMKYLKVIMKVLLNPVVCQCPVINR